MGSCHQRGDLSSPSVRRYPWKRMHLLPCKRVKRKGVTLGSDTVKVSHETDGGFCSSSTFRCINSQSRRKKNSRNRIKIPKTVASRRWTFSPLDLPNYKRSVVIVSYNILGVDNVSKHPDLYYNVHPKLLNWEGRKKLIHKEIIHYNPSIICFQEVDRFNDLEDLFVRDGYKGTYKARTGDAWDGCAIFWKDEQCTLLHQETIEFQRFGLRNNVAQLCVLKMKYATCRQKSGHSDRCLLVGNIHALFNPNRGDIKLGQVRLLLKKAFELSKRWGNLPVVLAGDLNSVPQSALYQFLASSQLNIQLFHRKSISGQVGVPLSSCIFRSPNEHAVSISGKVEARSSSWTFRSQREHDVRFGGSLSRPVLYNWSKEEIEIASGSANVTALQHHFNLCSAYAGVPGCDGMRDGIGEPLVTSCHSKFTGTVDYIWHTEDLIPVRVLETLPLSVLKKLGGLPSKEWGSDHLALVCELAFVNDYLS